MENLAGRKAKIVFEDIDNTNNERKATKRPIQKIKQITPHYIHFKGKRNKEHLIPSKRVIRLSLKDKNKGEDRYGKNR